MDIFKEWFTGAHVVDFSVIHYRVLRLRTQNANTRKGYSSRITDLEAAQAQILENGGFVTFDVAAEHLWIFGQSDERIAEFPSLIQSMGDVDWDVSQVNQVRAAHLVNEEHTLLTVGPVPSQSIVQTIHTTTSGTQSHDKRAMQANAAIPMNDANGMWQGSPEVEEPSLPNSKHIYEKFIASVVRSISYYLARYRHMIPLNFRTFVSCLPNEEAMLNVNPSHEYEPITSLSLFDIKLQLTTAGSLVISSVSKSREGIKRLHRLVSQRERQLSICFGLIRIAPSGMIVKNAQSLRLKPQEVDFDWRSALVIWLRQRGMYLENLEHEKSWTQITLPYKVAGSTNDNEEHLSGNMDMVVDWPVDLCFCYDKSDRNRKDADSENFSIGNDHGTQWYKTEDQPGFEDPLEFTQTWLLNKTKRADEIEARRVQRTEMENAQSRLDVDQLSPFARYGHFGDSQPPNGVYPTPPDGFPSQMSRIGSHQEGISFQNIDQPNPSEVPGTHGIEVSDANAEPSGKREPQPLSRSMSLDFEVEGSGGFFAEDDEDLFETADMTEADFSFFDEPDNVEGKLAADVDAIGSAASVVPKIEPDETIGHTTTLSSDVCTVVPSSDGTGQYNNDSDTLMKLDTREEDEGPLLTDDITMQASQHSLPAISSPELRTSKPNGSAAEGYLNEAYMTERASHHKNFNAVHFNPQLTVLDNKYGRQGRFGFLDTNIPNLRSISSKTPDALTVPTLKKFPNRKSSVMISRGVQGGGGNVHDFADSIDVSDSEDGDSGTEFMPSPSSVKSSSMHQVVQNWPKGQNGSTSGDSHSRDNMLTSKETPSGASPAPHHLKSTTAIELQLSKDFSPNPADWSLVGFPAPRTQTLSCKTVPRLNKEGLIATAQVLMDQLTLKIAKNSVEESSKSELPTITLTSVAEVSAISDTVHHFFPKAEMKDLLSYTAIESSPETPNSGKGQPRPVHRRSNTSGNLVMGAFRDDSQIFQIPSAHVRVNKTDSSWELLPPALSFWDTIGLGPCSGPKDVAAYCVYPFSEGIQPYAQRFLETVANSYENLKLGQHAIGSAVNEMEPGLVPVRLSGPVTSDAVFEAIHEVCVFLGRGLAKTDNAQKCIVIYLVEPFEPSEDLFEICSCFWELYRAYREAAPRLHNGTPSNELTLQIVPISMLASFDSPFGLQPRTAAMLAREVYERCPPGLQEPGESGLAILSGSSIQLETSMPKQIQFQLGPESASDILNENSCIHVAYHYSHDWKWVSASWVDNIGKYQAAMSYCLTDGRTFTEVATEIWDTTLDFIRPRRVTWRVFIAKVGFLSSDEKATWTSLARSPKQVSTNLTVLSVDTSPTIAVTPKSSYLEPRPLPLPYTTPVNTPQPLPSSPEPQSVGTPTDPVAAADADPNATLADITSETWGVLLSHQLNTSPSLVELHPALASGYIMKRAGTSDHAGVVLLEVNLMASEPGGVGIGSSSGSSSGGGGGGGGGPSGPQTQTQTRTQTQRVHAALLREVLGMYARLGLLARLRGVEDRVASVRPWHVAVVVKAAAALAKHMPV